MALGRGSCPWPRGLRSQGDGYFGRGHWSDKDVVWYCLCLALSSGTTDLLCCKFFYFLLLQNFYPKKREDVLNDTRRSGIGAKQAMTGHAMLHFRRGTDNNTLGAPHSVMQGIVQDSLHSIPHNDITAGLIPQSLQLGIDMIK